MNWKKCQNCGHKVDIEKEIQEAKKEAFEKGYVKGFKERINKTLGSSHNEPKA